MTAPRDRKLTIPFLSNEQIQQLNAQFAALRTTLICPCPSCSGKHAFHKNGTLATDPPQPKYIRKNCGKCYSAHAMADIIANAPTSSDADSPSGCDDMEISRQPALNADQSLSQDDDAPCLADLLATISRLTAESSQTRAELQKAQEEISQLRSQVSSRTAHPDLSLNVSRSPNLSFATQSPIHWRDPVRLQNMKQALQSQHQQQRQQQ